MSCLQFVDNLILMCYHIDMIKHSIRYFNKKEVRAVWDNEQSMWWYSAVDFINILVEPNSPRRYWNNVKVRNPELSPFCGQLKLYADDGKKYVSDVINEAFCGKRSPDVGRIPCCCVALRFEV